MARNHLADIERGMIDKGNVIGIRKLLNANWRNARGYWSSCTEPANLALAPTIQHALREYQPRADGHLSASGLAVINNPRWRKRWNERQRAIIDQLDHFRLVRFDDVQRGQFVPVWRAVSLRGDSFLFRNIPWQTAWAYGLESGPTIETE